MTPVEGATAIGKFTEAVKDLPTWLFLAFAAAAGILRFVPIVSAELPETYRPWLVVFLVVFGMLALLKPRPVEGRVRLGDETWSARSARDIEVGTEVEIVSVDRLTLVVRPAVREG